MSGIPLDVSFGRFVEALADDDRAAAVRLLGEDPGLARTAASVGATRSQAAAYFLPGAGHYVYAGATGLHVAAGRYSVDLVQLLLDRGANVRARDRRGAEPLHFAADGQPGAALWNPAAQAATIGVLVAAGAEPNARDANGATPLHRAARTRCSAAVRALLEAGADPLLPNRSGSVPMDLARQTTGRGGSGSPAAKAEQAVIIDLLGYAEPGQAD